MSIKSIDSDIKMIPLTIQRPALSDLRHRSQLGPWRHESLQKLGESGAIQRRAQKREYSNSHAFPTITFHCAVSSFTMAAQLQSIAVMNGVFSFRHNFNGRLAFGTVATATRNALEYKYILRFASSLSALSVISAVYMYY